MPPLPPSYAIHWHAMWQFPSATAQAPWYAARERVEAPVRQLVTTRLWPRLHVTGQDFGPGTPFETVEDVCGRLPVGQRVRFVLTSGEPLPRQDSSAPGLVVVLDLTSSFLELEVFARGAELEQLGRAALDDAIAWIAATDDALRAFGRLLLCRAIALGLPDYPRPRPPRVAIRATDAIVELLDPAVVVDDSNERWTRDVGAIARAALPASATRTTAGRLEVIRWVEDPLDVEAVGRAAGQHEAWIAPLLSDAEVASNWNADGDRAVVVNEPAQMPGFWIVDRRERCGYVELGAAPLDEAAWRSIETLVRAPPPGIEAIGLIVPGRSAALVAYPRARALGVRRVVYLSPARTFWDPAPPGNWI